VRQATGAETLSVLPAVHAPEERRRAPVARKAAWRNDNQILTTPVGLRVLPGLTFEQWAEAGPKISRLLNMFAWCLGDWLVYGQEHFESRYAQAVERVGLDYQTLRNYAWVARRFEASRRRSGLSFQHHAEVASRPRAEQDAWLDRAEKHRWSRNQLRRQLRQAGTPDPAPLPAAIPRPEVAAAIPRFEVEEARLASWRLAAANASTDLASWIVSTLDEAAARLLDPGPDEPAD
jgi:hypothetical protein